MSFNSSSSSNASLLPPPLSSSNMYYKMIDCLSSPAGAFSVTAFSITSILLLLPLCILILYLGCQQRRQRRSTTVSHSNVLTYHMVILELMSVFGSFFCCCAAYAGLQELMVVGLYLLSANLNGQVFFHILTCVERYLAVVHPITYLGLREAKGIRIRNVVIGCVWLLSFAGTGAMNLREDVIVFFSFGILGFVLIVISFCSLSVLCVLIRSGPAGGVGGRQRVDQSKLRAFFTIMAILGVLLLRFGGNILVIISYTLLQIGEAEMCVLSVSVLWFSLPSSLVLPLLFLHKAGKLACCKNNTASG